MTHRRSHLTSLAALLTLSMVVAACGGGGGAPAAAVPETTAGAAVTGNAVKGPVSGATIRAFGLAGGLQGPQVGSAVTDAQGAFAMQLGAHAGPLLLQMTGGSYIDEASGATVTLAPGEMMTAVLSSLPPGTTATVQVTPLTAMAQAMAARMPGGMTPPNIDAANAAIGNYFMVGDVLHTRPINPLATGSAIGASPAMINYGMALAGMSQYASSAGVPSSGFVGAMMLDAADGVLDGRAGTTAITMGPGMMGGAMMQSGAGGAGLATAMGAFMHSAGNRSGVDPAAMTQLMQQLATQGGRIR